MMMIMITMTVMGTTVPLRRRLFAGLSIWKLEFNSRLVHVGFLVHRLTLVAVLLRILVSPYQDHSTMFHTHLLKIRKDDVKYVIDNVVNQNT